MAESRSNYPVMHFHSRAEWAEWLKEYHATERGVWVRLAKRASKLPSVTRDESLEVALCYGWIDGQARSHDDDSWLQKFTPRTKRSVWSKRNREHAERLIASGQMQPAGLAEVRAAQADGRWERAYDSPSTATIPEDFQRALEAHPQAREFFETLSGTNRYAILHGIQTAVKPETRARRIEKFIEMLERKEKSYR